MHGRIFSGSAVLTWTGGTPDDVSIDAWKYRVINGICYFNISISATDGNNAVGFQTTLPVNPAETVYVNGVQTINEASEARLAVVVSGANFLTVIIQQCTDGQLLNISPVSPRNKKSPPSRGTKNNNMFTPPLYHKKIIFAKCV